MGLWKKVEQSNSGEPGFYWSNDLEWGTNPCCEIALRPYQFCNLVEVNGSDIKDQLDLNSRLIAASTIGTIQASYTDFHYLRDVWKETTELDALVGIGMTGIASNAIEGLDLQQAVNLAKLRNESLAPELKINTAARMTCVKPSGTSSIVLGTSSGIHAWHDDYYIRRVRVGKEEALYKYLSVFHPEVLEDDAFSPDTMSVISIPQAAPSGSVTSPNETSLEFLNRIAKMNEEWIQPGHTNGANSHNISATVSVGADEWGPVGDWLWDNQGSYNGLSFLPRDLGTYTQAPFESITRAKYMEMASTLHSIDPSAIKEDGDYTDLKGEAACAGGACEIK
jgi:ribonucleoside-diphosphate reductase alpha chain